MGERIGYVVLEWNQASHQPDTVNGGLFTDLDWAREMAAAEQAHAREVGRTERYTVAKVIEMEDSDE